MGKEWWVISRHWRVPLPSWVLSACLKWKVFQLNYSSVLFQFPFKSLCGVCILEREEQILAHNQISGWPGGSKALSSWLMCQIKLSTLKNAGKIPCEASVTFACLFWSQTNCKYFLEFVEVFPVRELNFFQTSFPSAICKEHTGSQASCKSERPVCPVYFTEESLEILNLAGICNCC